MAHHKHIYVYQFQMRNHPTWPGTCILQLMESIHYVLMKTGPNSKANKKLLEEALRIVYGHMPKGVKFLYEKK
jgi:hypothetical protein